MVFFFKIQIKLFLVLNSITFGSKWPLIPTSKKWTPWKNNPYLQVQKPGIFLYQRLHFFKSQDQKIDSLKILMLKKHSLFASPKIVFFFFCKESFFYIVGWADQKNGLNKKKHITFSLFFWVHFLVLWTHKTKKMDSWIKRIHFLKLAKMKEGD